MKLPSFLAEMLLSFFCHTLVGKRKFCLLNVEITVNNCITTAAIWPLAG